MRLSSQLLVAASWLMLPCGAVLADEWAIDPAVGARMTYNDNINMQVNHPTSVTYYSLSPSVKFSSRTESRDVAMAFGLGANRYPGDSQYNAVDHNVDLSSKWTRELDGLTLGASSLRDSTLNSEFENTGVVVVRRQRTQNRLTGSWEHGLGDTTFSTLALSGTQVRYESGPNLVDFDDNMAAIGLREQLSERASLTATYSRRNYRTLNGNTPLPAELPGWIGLYQVVDLATDGNVRSNVDTVTVGGQWRYSERLVLGLDVGRFRSRSKQDQTVQVCYMYLGSVFSGCDAPVSGTELSKPSGSTYTFSSGYQLERGNINANLSRGLTASGTGSLLRTDAGGLSYQHRFDDALSFGLGGSSTRSHYLTNIGAADARLVSLASSLTWQLDQRLQLTGGYTYTRQRAVGQPEATRGNLVYVSLKWDLAPLSKSR
jgi:hypothetical protein